MINLGINEHNVFSSGAWNKDSIIPEGERLVEFDDSYPVVEGMYYENNEWIHPETKEPLKDYVFNNLE